MTGPFDRAFDFGCDPDLDRADPGRDCPRCARPQANVLSDGVGCWDCDAEIREMFQGEESDHAGLS